MTSHQLLSLCETIRAELLPRFPEILGVRFSINNRYRGRAGTCRPFSSEVILSGYFYVQQSQNDAAAQNTIRHELAHYIAWKRFKALNHGHLWRITALAMGCNGHRCTAVKSADERQMVCQHCNHLTECSERRMRKWDRAGRRMLCKACRKILPYPWSVPMLQAAEAMPKRMLAQKGLDNPQS